MSQVTVVIVHRNRPERLRDTVDALRGQTVPTRVIVVDAGSEPVHRDAAAAIVAERTDDEHLAFDRNLGFGPGAARYIDGRREVNHRSVTTWLRRVLEGTSATGESEQLAPPERAREALAIGLRRMAGVERLAFRETTGFDLDELAGPAIARLAAAGLIENQPAGIRLTREGRFFADSVAVELV